MKHSTEKKKRTKLRNCWEENLAAELKSWAMQPTAMIIEKFYTSKMIPRSTYYDAIERNAVLKEAHQFAMERIGINHEEMAYEQKLTMSHVMAASLPQYMPRWKEDIEWRHKLKAQEDDKSKNITVIMEPFDKRDMECK